ncbi:MAG: triose-phosphate isomerase [Burkholderiales bacterium]|nr:triose-phosphate isomerase [Burkholderiales bacterium]
MRNRFVIGNWKLNGSLVSNGLLLNTLKTGFGPAIAGKTCVVCVPTPYLSQAQTELIGSGIEWGSQDVSCMEIGAYTGEVSAGMVAEFGAKFAIIGHSERRAVFGDTDAMVASKFGSALKSGLVPVLCVGESLAERESGKTQEVIWRQLHATIETHGIKSLSLGVLAYEPVWAIGTGKTATPGQADEVHAFLRGKIRELNLEVGENLSILYGGSVKKSNAVELFAKPDIDGGLIGGASLVAEEFLGIWNAL